ncbi:Dipeptidyl-peptidase_III [Hexamita inflata]|uniref:Dipeptidyl-peptidase III n=1 Tax=Hexamita inflata TaxID=28002 RepID=A0AA86UQC5_9EUKA|nr:Dipeptidyl-peptidase III [Hexamita inflata]
MAQNYNCYTDYPVGNLKPKNSLQNISKEQNQYAAHLSLAAYASFPILAEQVSKESLQIHEFLYEFLKPFVQKKLTFEQFQYQMAFKHLYEFAGQFYYQGGNFQGYGDLKFVPRSNYAEIQKFLQTNDLFQAALSKLEFVKESMYNLERPIIQFEPQGQTTYYSTSINEADVIEIDKLHGLMAENTTIREEGSRYVIEIASIEKKTVKTDKVYKNKQIDLEYGKYSQHLEKIIPHLKNAITATQSQLEKEMLAELIAFYTTGDMKHHLEYSRLWVKNSEPTVETYQGFIETYRDPHGVRAEMEAFVAVVDPESSKILSKLLDPAASAQILASLPVPSFMHRDTFVPPSYKAIEIVSFICSGMPIGINIPNYDAIRQGFGYKNVTLQNCVSARQGSAKDVQYISSPQIRERINSQQKKCTDSEVALHELFGHGSCRLIFEQDLEKLTPEQKQFIVRPYKPNETYYGTFQSLQSAFEECRAEVTAHYLNDTELPNKIFGVENKTDFMLCSVYSMVFAGIQGTMQFDVTSNNWLQAHSQANHLILRNILQRTDAIQINIINAPTQENSFAEQLEININESKFAEITEANKWLVNKLNVLKTGGDYEGAKQLFAELTKLDEKWLKFREIAVKQKKPRIVMLPGRITLENGEYVIENAKAIDGKEAFEAAEQYVHNLIQAGI